MIERIGELIEVSGFCNMESRLEGNSRLRVEHLPYQC